MSDRLAHWNALDPAAAAAEVLPCNGSRAWARGLAEQRPVMTEDDLLVCSDKAWRVLAEQDWLEAFATHPRIGERHNRSASLQSLAWSDQEQANVHTGDEAQTLATANLAYEARFGRTFLICASGLTRLEVLQSLTERLRQTPQQELFEAAEQQRRITRLRLCRWLGGSGG